MSKKDVIEDDLEDIDLQNILKQKQSKISKNILQKKGVMKSKLGFMVKMLKMQKLLREQSENIVKIKIMNNNKLPQGILLEGRDAIAALPKAKTKDKKNAMRPNYDQ